MNYFSDEQIKAIQNISNEWKHIGEIFEKAARDAFKDSLGRIKELWQMVKKVFVKEKLRYKLIKEIKPKVSLRINKPQTIHCRNNC